MFFVLQVSAMNEASTCSALFGLFYVEFNPFLLSNKMFGIFLVPLLFGILYEL